MRDETVLSVLWRRKWIVIVTFLVLSAGTAALSKSLPKIYATSSRLIVVQAQDASSFDAAQAAQVTARTYADLIANANFAQEVANRIGGGTTKDDIETATSFEAVTDTQLLKITAEDRSAAKAQRIANTYALVFVDYARTRLATTTKATVSLAAAAPLPDAPARPKPTLYTVLAGILGLVLGTALAFLRERLDFRFRSSEDIETRFDVPVLGRIPRRGKGEISVNNFTDAFRVLRTNLAFAAGERRLRTLVIASGLEGEGKTTTVVQLALANAEIGTSVLLVDADIRRPALEQAIVPNRTEPLEPGFGDYLVGRATLDEVIHPTGTSNVDLVPAGSAPQSSVPGDATPPSLSDLLETRLGRTALGGFAASGDLVVLDTPPLSVGADAAVLAGRVDGVILVVDLEDSTEQSVRNALRQLEAVKANVLGLVLNRDRSAEATSGYEYLRAAGSKRERLTAPRS